MEMEQRGRDAGPGRTEEEGRTGQSDDVSARESNYHIHLGEAARAVLPVGRLINATTTKLVKNDRFVIFFLFFWGGGQEGYSKGCKRVYFQRFEMIFRKNLYTLCCIENVLP